MAAPWSTISRGSIGPGGRPCPCPAVLRVQGRNSTISSARHVWPGGYGTGWRSVCRCSRSWRCPGPERISPALAALHSALSAVDPRNDGRLLWYDAVVAPGWLLGYVNADHWALV